jgi:hypothetical protein
VFGETVAAGIAKATLDICSVFEVTVTVAIHI